MRVPAIGIMMAMVFSTATSAHAAVVLTSGALNVIQGQAFTCHVVNAGKKPLEQVAMRIVRATDPEVSTGLDCATVPPGGACLVTTNFGGPDVSYCRVTIGKGAKKAVRATFCNFITGNCSEVR